MAPLKTQQTNKDVNLFIKGIENQQRKKDCIELLEIFKAAISLEPAMWGDSIIGFGSYHYKYKSGQEGDWFLTGFSPRKQNLTIYIMTGFSHFKNELDNLGKHKTSSSCLYVNKLEQIDIQILKQMIIVSVEKMRKAYPEKL